MIRDTKIPKKLVVGDEGMSIAYPNHPLSAIPKTFIYEFQPKFQDVWTSNKTRQFVPDKLHSFPFEFVALESCPPSFEGFFLVIQKQIEQKLHS